MDSRDEIVKLLESEFKKNQEWKKGQIKEICMKTGLKYQSIYKWFWDRKKKCVLSEETPFMKNYYSCIEKVEKHIRVPIIFEVLKINGQKSFLALPSSRDSPL